MNYTAIARQYIANGFSVIPLQLDGSKSPAGSWKPFQGRSATDHELQQWFGNGEPCGLGIVAGGISGNLQILDFDLEAEKQFQRFWADAEKQLPGITNKILVVATPRPGRQVWFRKTSQPAGNQILAYSEPIPTEEYDADGQPISKPQVLIETRGTGGYAIAAGSHPSVHRTGKPYQLIHGRLEALPQLTDQEAENLLNICRSYNRFQPHHDGWKQGVPYAGEPRPGDIFNQLVDIRELLLKYHWQLHHKGHDGTEHWTRPGKEVAGGCSATLGYVGTDDDQPRLYVFTSGAAPLEQNRAYDAFSLYATVEHNGDFGAAAAAARQSYEAQIQAAQVQYRHDQELREEDWPEWPKLSSTAMHGLAGEIVTTLAPLTEADPAGLLIQLLTAFGNIVGRSAHVVSEDVPHYAKLFCALVGRSSRSRKGTSWGRIAKILRAGFPDWMADNLVSGIGSGEVIVHLVRDPVDALDKDGNSVIKDPGVSDKRKLIQEGELSKVLRVASRESSTLSPVLRDAWDDKTLQNTVKNSPATATNSHISLVGHITLHELHQTLRDVDIHNGFGNRILWVCVERAQILPLGEKLPDAEAVRFGQLFAGRAVQATNIGEVLMDHHATELFRSIYCSLDDPDGIVGSLISRAEGQILRLGLICALLDGSAVMKQEHLKAAYAVWDYCDKSVRFLFTGSLGDSLAEQVLEAIRNQGEAGMTKSQLQTHFSRNKTASHLGVAVRKLRDKGLIVEEVVGTGGRPKTVYKVVPN